MCANYFPSTIPINSFRVERWNPDEIDIKDTISAACFLGQMVEWEEKSQIGGFIFIFDTKGFNFKQFAAISIEDIKCASMQMQVLCTYCTTVRRGFFFQTLWFAIVVGFLDEIGRVPCCGRPESSS